VKGGAINATLFVLFVSLLSFHSYGDIGQNCTLKCHTEQLGHKFTHGPIEANGCAVCHPLLTKQNKFAKHPQLKKIKTKDFNSYCFACHDEMKMKLSKENHLHKAITKKNCVSCHNPHGASNKSLLKFESSVKLCTSCHDKVMPADSKGHQVQKMKEGCLSCHAPHSSKNHALMKEPTSAELCLKCHTKSKVLKDGRHLLASNKITSSFKFLHTPVREGKCHSCHSVHGSENKFLVESKFSKHTYPKDLLGSSQLCFQCHKIDRFYKRLSIKTNFRNGSQNLHYLHTLGSNKKRGCFTCHNIHGTQQDKLVRESFAYKQLTLPLKFIPSATGGNCTTACHKTFTYNRKVRFKNEQK
jgi:predicted CXXCH cytochrome family protein